MVQIFVLVVEATSALVIGIPSIAQVAAGLTTGYDQVTVRPSATGMTSACREL